MLPDFKKFVHCKEWQSAPRLSAAGRFYKNRLLKKWKRRMKISVIIPLYHGKKYLPDIMKMLLQNQTEGNDAFAIEVILVNDLPDEKISYEEIEHRNELRVILLTNQENKGIHFARVRGLAHASGEYVHFLDQDDKIAGNFYKSQIKHMRTKDDVIVANGIAEYESYRKLLYRYRFMQWTVKSAWFYTRFDCRIISPGQCLIQKSSIPDIWKKKILKHNGADDYFLWLAMLSQGKKFGINRELLYTHKYTSANASSDRETMRMSVDETLSVIAPMLGTRKVKMIQDRIRENNADKASRTLVSLVESINKT